jgi:hypothetical protein
MKRTIPWLFGLVAAVVQAGETADAPAPATDRVGFPKDYATTFAVLRTVQKKEESKVVTVYGNPAAATITNAAQLPYPYGSIIVMETAGARKDAQGRPVLDSQGNLSREQVLGLHVMRREKGFGEAYQTNRTGNWEYVEYRPDGTYITPPAKSATCAACHVKAGPEKDFVYHGRLAAGTK